MNNEQFLKWLAGEFGKYSVLKLSWKRGVVSLDELVYGLRMSGEGCDSNRTDEDEPGFGMIPSVQETFIPTRDLARKISSMEYEEFDNNGVVVPVISVVYAKK